MESQRRIHSLSLIAAGSLVPAAILICGYFANAGPTVTNVQTAQIARLQSTSVELDCGRIRIWLATQTPPPPGVLPGRTVRWSARPKLPDLDRCFWAFDNHSLNSVLRNKGATAYIIAFPIWCVLVPFLIAPALWLRKRRRSRTQTGFPINLAADRTAPR